MIFVLILYKENGNLFKFLKNKKPAGGLATRRVLAKRGTRRLGSSSVMGLAGRRAPRGTGTVCLSRSVVPELVRIAFVACGGRDPA